MIIKTNANNTPHLHAIYSISTFYLGPDRWDEIHLVPGECHIKQSPINIIPQDAIYDERLKTQPLEFVYDASQAKQLTNNGHSVQVTYNCDGSCKFNCFIHFHVK